MWHVGGLVVLNKNKGIEHSSWLVVALMSSGGCFRWWRLAKLCAMASEAWSWMKDSCGLKGMLPYFRVLETEGIRCIGGSWQCKLAVGIGPCCLQWLRRQLLDIAIPMAAWLSAFSWIVAQWVKVQPLTWVAELPVGMEILNGNNSLLLRSCQGLLCRVAKWKSLAVRLPFGGGGVVTTTGRG